MCGKSYIFQNMEEFAILWKFYKLFLWIILESSGRRPLHPVPVNVIPVHESVCWLLRDPQERLGPGGESLGVMALSAWWKFKNKCHLLHFCCWVLVTNCVCWRHLDLNMKISIWICSSSRVFSQIHPEVDILSSALHTHYLVTSILYEMQKTYTKPTIIGLYKNRCVSVKIR